ncbi:acetylornithine deacetylase [Colletotrichum higginsianum]|nr:acetylornithine deacetylase [Colletotrichum higginsianum]
MTYRFFFFLSILFASVCVADDAEIIDLHKSLVSIQSTTKTGDPQTDERNVQTFIENWLKETAEKNNFKINIERQQVTEGRDNLYVYTGDKIYGRGANDAKGCVAAMMIAFRDLLINKQIKEEGDLSLLFVVGEEIGGEGMTEVPKLGLTWDTVIFGEPTDSKLASGQIGGMVFNITTLGKTVHSGFPELGINAIDRLRMIMDALHLVLDELDSNPKYGQNSLTLAQIRGGVADNAVPPSAWVSGSYRLTISPSQVVEKIGRLINEKVCPETQYDPKDTEKPCKSVAVKYPLQDDPLDIDHDVPGKPVLPWLNQT